MSFDLVLACLESDTLDTAVQHLTLKPQVVLVKDSFSCSNTFTQVQGVFFCVITGVTFVV
jgi:hypothetical protein